MTEQERIVAIPKLMSWTHQDETVKIMVRAVLRVWDLPSVGHLARFQPDSFDELFEESEAMITNPE